MLNILILEDCPERIKWFKKIFHDCDLFYTKDIKEAYNSIKNKDYDIIFLDRDLGHLKESGEDLVLSMRKEELAQDSCIIVHTVNPSGQNSMKKYLSEYHNNFHIIDFTKLRKMKREDFN